MTYWSLPSKWTIMPFRTSVHPMFGMLLPFRLFEDPGIVRVLVLHELGVGEEDRDLAGRGLNGVRAVDEVVALGAPVVAADRPGLGVEAERRAQELADDRDRLVALDRHHHDGRRRDELHQGGIERPLLVDRVQRLGLLRAHLDELEPDDAETLVLEALDDAADQTALHAVGLDHAESAFHR